MSGWERWYVDGDGRNPPVWPWTDLVRLVHHYLVPLGRPLRVLELGCGVGTNAPLFEALGFAYYGVDASATAIDCCRSRFPELNDRVTVGDFTERLPFDGPFDAVVERHAMTRNDSAAVRRAFTSAGDVLTSGGYFIGMVWMSKNDRSYGAGEATADPFCRTYAHGPYADVGLVQFFDEERIRRMLSNFEILQLDEVTTRQSGGAGLEAWWNVVARKPSQPS